MRPVARKFNPEELAKFHEASSKQTSKTRTPLTVDEEKYPMFEIPVCEKRIIYVPNFFETVEDEEGNLVKILRMDKGAFHNVRHRGSYSKYRCTSGISGIEGFDGSCPLCDSMPDNWELYNAKYADIGIAKGVDINSDEAKDALRDERKDLISNMAVSNKNIEYTFPIVEFETKPGTLDFVLDEHNIPKGRIKWYRIAESTFKEKWESNYETLDDKCVAGKFFILDYTYDAKNGKPTKMQSASSLKVLHKPVLGTDAERNAFFQAIMEHYDKEAEEWTPGLSMSTIYSNMPYDVETLAQITDEVMQPTRDQLLVYGSKGAGQEAIGTSNSTSPEAIAQNFGAEPEGEVAGADAQ